MSGLIAYAPTFALRAVSLCFYILPPVGQPIILNQVSGRIAYAPIFALQ